MPRFRAQAELRRVHDDAAWVVAGVLIDGSFFPAMLDIERAGARLIESGLVKYVELAPLIAPDLRRAVGIARRLALAHGEDPASSAARDVLRGGGEVTIGGPRK